MMLRFFFEWIFPWVGMFLNFGMAIYWWAKAREANREKLKIISQMKRLSQMRENTLKYRKFLTEQYPGVVLSQDELDHIFYNEEPLP